MYRGRHQVYTVHRRDIAVDKLRGSSVASTLIIFAIMQGIFMITYKEDEEVEEDEQTSEISPEGTISRQTNQ